MQIQSLGGGAVYSAIWIAFSCVSLCNIFFGGSVFCLTLSDENDIGTPQAEVRPSAALLWTSLAMSVKGSKMRRLWHWEVHTGKQQGLA